MGYLRSAIIVILLLAWSNSFAATYYVNPSSANDVGNGSEASPKKYIVSGIGLMTAGDTLILEDGTYTGAENMMRTDGYGGYGGSGFPPSGTSRSNFTTVRARNIGMAIIDGEYARTPFSNANLNTPSSYIHIDGIHFRHGAGAADATGAGVFAISGSYMWVTNCGFEDGVPPADDTTQAPIAYMSGGSDHVLFEDCWAWGKGRYGLYFQSSEGGVTNSIFRRCVIRQDDAKHGPTAGMMFYNSAGNTIQNSIVVDSRVSPTSQDTYGAFSMTSIDAGTNDNHVVGSIGLHNINYSGFAPQLSELGDVATVENTVLWDNGDSFFVGYGSGHGATVTSSDLGTYNMIHLTVGESNQSGFRSNSGYQGVLNAYDSISVNNGAYGFEYITNANYISAYGNVSGKSVGGGSFGGTQLTENPFTTSLKYLPRIEGGALKGAASDGGDIGATILYQIGYPGSFMGETDWDATTTNQLWPLPNESIWAAKMKAYTASGPGGNRGFAALSGATSTPLTDYIWEYLGNPKPNIYGTPSSCSTPNGIQDGDETGIDCGGSCPACAGPGSFTPISAGTTVIYPGTTLIQ